MEDRCPQCNARVAQPDQERCLECGNELEGHGPHSSGDLSTPTTQPPQESLDQTLVNTLHTESLTPAVAEPLPTLKIKLPTGDEYVKQIAQPLVRLGKGSHNDIVISDPSVSSAHALIARGDNVYTISDLGSRNGTFVNQERVTQPIPLRGGDVINLGRSRLTFQSSSAGDTVALPTIEMERPTLVGVMPDGSRIEQVIDRTETGLGKAPHNQVVVADPTVSSAHAVILSRGGEYRIVDLGSRNGTYVDGEKLGSEPRVLKHGDTIRLGITVLTFRHPSSAAETTTALPRELVDHVSRQSGDVVVESAGAPAVGTFGGQAAGEDAIGSAPQAAAGLASKLEAEPADVQAKAPEKDKAKKPDKDKKKKKKKEKDERLRAAYIGALGRVVAAVLSVILTVGIAFYIKEGGLAGNPEVTAGRKGKAKLKLGDVTEATQISGGTFEASGVIQVPDSNGVLFVDDNRSSQVLWMQLDDAGHQLEAAHPVELGTTVQDPEGITYGGSYFYVAGSQSDPKAGAGNALVRFSFDPASTALRGKAEVVADLRTFLLQQVPELKSVSQNEKYAVDIEGISWDPNHERLLLGLRAPVVDGQALIIPIKLRDPRGAFASENLEVGGTLRLPLGGLGVRDIQYDSRLKSFLIITGQSAHGDKKAFKLWEWDGNPVKGQDESALREDRTLDEKVKPEGICRVAIGDQGYLLVMGDAGSYYKIDYSKD